jgi:hypothetical protein
MIHEDGKHGGVAGLTGPDEYDKRAAFAVDEVMDLRR